MSDPSKALDALKQIVPLVANLDMADRRWLMDYMVRSLSPTEEPAKFDEWSRPRSEWCRCGAHYMGQEIESHTDLEEVRHTLARCAEDGDEPASPPEEPPECPWCERDDGTHPPECPYDGHFEPEAGGTGQRGGG